MLRACLIYGFAANGFEEPSNRIARIGCLICQIDQSILQCVIRIGAPLACIQHQCRTMFLKNAS
jgi:hypothetical protein